MTTIPQTRTERNHQTGQSIKWKNRDPTAGKYHDKHKAMQITYNQQCEWP